MHAYPDGQWLQASFRHYVKYALTQHTLFGNAGRLPGLGPRPVRGSRPLGRWPVRPLVARHQDDLGALAAHAQDPVAVLLAEVRDIQPVASKIFKPSSPQDGHQRDVAPVRRFPDGGEQGT
jgi:hypothetical protein